MPRTTSSSLPDFRKLPAEERRRRIAELTGLEAAELDEAFEHGGLSMAEADKMVENAIGSLGLPFGIAMYFRINGVDYLVPMAIEEPSVIAAASHAAKRVRADGGFVATATEPLMVAQIEVHGVADGGAAIARLASARDELIALADAAVRSLRERGGGARDVTARDIGEGSLVAHVVVDCRDAMGANLVNTIAESVGPRVAEICGGELGLRILTNYCDLRCTRVTAQIPVASLHEGASSGLAVARGIVRASSFAERDVHRAATHNKGIMNGIDAVAVATGNDWRAVEAGAHTFACRTGRYAPLSRWRLDADEKHLLGELEVPLALGVVGGALRAHRAARAALAILGVESAIELSMVAASAGLATNLAALRALVTEGIQRGHMALHHRASPGKLR